MKNVLGDWFYATIFRDFQKNFDKKLKIVYFVTWIQFLGNNFFENEKWMNYILKNLKISEKWGKKEYFWGKSAKKVFQNRGFTVSMCIIKIS